nr:hypothetical protein [Tessaracoccus coleopterorum]
MAISSALCGLAPGYWSLLFFRGLGGIGSVMFTVSSMGLLVRLSPRRSAATPHPSTAPRSCSATSSDPSSARSCPDSACGCRSSSTRPP